MLLLRMLNRYLLVTMGYGAARTVGADCYNYYNDMKRTRPMLLTDAAARVVVQSIKAVTAWPCMLYVDLKRLECAARGLKASEYDVN